MRLDAKTVEHFKDTQDRMLRLAERDYGLTPTQLAAETGIPLDTLRSYRRTDAREPSIMSALTLMQLARVLPNELTSLLFEFADKSVVDSAHGKAELLELGAESAALASLVCAANADGKVTPIERAGIADQARRVAAKATGVARG